LRRRSFIFASSYNTCDYVSLRSICRSTASLNNYTVSILLDRQWHILLHYIDCPVGAARVLSDYTAAELLYYSPIDYRHLRTKWFFWTAAQSTVPPNYAWSRWAKSIIPSPLPRHIFDVNPFIYTISRRVFAESPSVVWYRRKSCILRSKQAPLYTATNAIQYNMVDMHF